MSRKSSCPACLRRSAPLQYYVDCAAFGAVVLLGLVAAVAGLFVVGGFFYLLFPWSLLLLLAVVGVSYLVGRLAFA